MKQKLCFVITAIGTFWVDDHPDKVNIVASKISFLLIRIIPFIGQHSLRVFLP